MQPKVPERAVDAPKSRGNWIITTDEWISLALVSLPIVPLPGQ